MSSVSIYSGDNWKDWSQLHETVCPNCWLVVNIAKMWTQRFGTLRIHNTQWKEAFSQSHWNHRSNKPMNSWVNSGLSDGEHNMTWIFGISVEAKSVYYCPVWPELQDNGAFPPRQTSLNLPPSSWVCHSVVRVGSWIRSAVILVRWLWVTIASDCRPFPSSAATAEEVMFISGR